MENIKIAFFDIDGTLLNFGHKKPTEKTLEALRRLQQRGIRICLSTGRTAVTLPEFEDIEFDACITFNGSLCRVKEKVIFSAPIPPEDVTKLLRNAAKLNRPIALATRERLAANGTDADLTEYYSFAHVTLTVAEDFEEAARQQVYQMMLGCRESEYPIIMEGVTGAKIAAWWERAVDIIPAVGGKGNGIQRVLEHFGLRREEALAFGDGNNDVEMLQAVGIGVAMGNASEKLKAVAHRVCGTVAEDGIYHYCLENGLI